MALLLLVPRVLHGFDAPVTPPIQAASLSFSDVQSAVNSADHNQDVILPEGNTGPGGLGWDASKNLIITKAIRIIGAGMHKTVIQSAAIQNGPGNAGVFVFKTNASTDHQDGGSTANYWWGIQGLTIFDTGGGTACVNVQAKNNPNGTPARAPNSGGITGLGGGFRITDVRLRHLNNGRCLFLHDVAGVVDHSWLDNTNDGDQWLDVDMEAFAGGVEGHGSWRTRVDLEDAEDIFKFLVFEDCLMSTGGADGAGGHRYMVRHCRLMNGARYINHGAESHSHGGRFIIGDHNWISGGTGTVGEIRSGTFLCHDNIVTDHPNLWMQQNHRGSTMKNNGSVRGENPTWQKKLNGNNTTNFATFVYSPPVDQNTELLNPAGLPTFGNPPDNGNVSEDEATGTVGTAGVTYTTGGSITDANGVTYTGGTLTDPNYTWTTTANAEQFRTWWPAPNPTPAANPGPTVTPNQNNNKGYSYALVNVSDPFRSAAKVIINDAHRLIVYRNEVGASFSLATGDVYAVRKCYLEQDQPGAGMIEMTADQADNSGAAATIPNQNTNEGVVNTTNSSESVNVGASGAPSNPRDIGWMNQKLDPSFAWNNRKTISGSIYEMNLLAKEGSGNIREKVHFFNNQVRPVPGYISSSSGGSGLSGMAIGALMNETYASGYPIISSPTAKDRQIGAEITFDHSDAAAGYPGSTPFSNLDGDTLFGGNVSPTLWPAPPTYLTRGFAYPHPLVQAAVPVPRIEAPFSKSFSSQVTTSCPATNCHQFTSSGFTGTPTWSQAAVGSQSGLPSNVTLSSSGQLTVTAGQYPATGEYDTTVTATVVSPAQTATHDFHLTVLSPKPAPTVTLSVSGAPFVNPASVILTADPSISGGFITRIDFRRGTAPTYSTVIATLGTPPYTDALTGPYIYTWTPVGTGTYNVIARAYDDSTVPQTGDSDPATVTVSPSPTPPPGGPEAPNEVILKP